jgi:hypothetical protein
MKYPKPIIYSLITFLLLLYPADLFSQVKGGSTGYKPELGQEGKDVRWFPTPQILVEKMLDMAKITPVDFLIDLGSGDGRTVISAAKRGAHAIGIEYDPDMVKLSLQNAVREGVKDKVEFIKADLFEYDFSKATVVTMFLLPEINLRLRPRLLGLKPGTRIISTKFTMQAWQYDDMVKIEDKTNEWTSAYLWIVPAKVDGVWIFPEGELNLKQVFQMVSGTIIRDGKSMVISRGKVRGNEITFSGNGTVYTCQVDKNNLKGTADREGKITEWKAERKK